VKPLYLPDTLERFILPTLKPLSQLVVYKLIRYSGIDYRQTIWPSVATLARLCNAKKRDTIRAALYELQAEKIITIIERFEQNKQTSNHYIFNFDFWENIDKIRGIEILHDETGAMLKRVAADVRQVKKNTNSIQKEFSTLRDFFKKQGYAINNDNPADISHLSSFAQVHVKQFAEKKGIALAFRAS